jgi:hypothetical protein
MVKFEVEHLDEITVQYDSHFVYRGDFECFYNEDMPNV